MARTITQQELRNDDAKVVDAVAAGETFVVTRPVAVAELTPIERPSALLHHIDRANFQADLDRMVDRDRCSARNRDDVDGLGN